MQSVDNEIIENARKLKTGDRVDHPTFGPGTVRHSGSAPGIRGGHMVTVEYDNPASRIMGPSIHYTGAPGKHGLRGLKKLKEEETSEEISSAYETYFGEDDDAKEPREVKRRVTASRRRKHWDADHVADREVDRREESFADRLLDLVANGHTVLSALDLLESEEEEVQLHPHGHERPYADEHGDDPDILHSTLHVYTDDDETTMEEAIRSELWYLVEKKGGAPAVAKAVTKKLSLKDEKGRHGLSYNEAHEITGGLSWPSKMPGPAFNTPAKRCQMGVILHGLAKKTGKKTVCGGCYALKGRYVFPNVQGAAERRFSSLSHPKWAEAMATLIEHHARTDRVGKEFNHAHFRWHDSGDLQSPEHLGQIAKVAELTKDAGVQHWLPTREYKHVEDYKRSGGHIPENLTVRLSGHYVDHPPPRSKGLPVSSVSSGAKDTSLDRDIRAHGGDSCPAPSQGNQCKYCRRCWDPKVGHVVYHEN